MKTKEGIVKEVYLLDYDETLIGFKVEVDNRIFDIITKQTIDNSNIYREDKVYVTIDKIDNQEVYDILKKED